LVLLLSAINCVRAQNVSELIQAQGYGVEEHYAYTQDGFTLSLQRVISPKVPAQKNLPPILMQHGFLDTAATWVLNEWNESLAFILADAGYDVWLSNSRGNSYSWYNKYYDQSQTEYWEWSWDEMALYDLPALIETILGWTNKPHVVYLGHSQGCTLGFAGMLLNSSIASSVKLYIAVAPVTYLAGQKSMLLSTLANLHVDALLPDGMFEPTPVFMRGLLGPLCNAHPSWCNAILDPLSGTPNNLDPNRLGLYLAHWPDSTSLRDFKHWLQGVRSGEYQMYNNGPDYDLSQWPNIPVAVFHGSVDYLGDENDVSNLISVLGSNVVYNFDNDYAHMDFVWSTDASSEVYPKILAVLNKYANSL